MRVTKKFPLSEWVIINKNARGFSETWGNVCAFSKTSENVCAFRAPASAAVRARLHTRPPGTLTWPACVRAPVKGALCISLKRTFYISPFFSRSLSRFLSFSDVAAARR